MFYQKYLISGLLVACAIPASAASLTTFCVPGPPCTYANSSAASAAFTTATSSDTFTNISFTAGSLGTSYTDAGSGLEFNDLLGLIGVANPSGWPSGTAITTGAGVSTETITVPSGVNAIEFYVGMQSYSNFTISVTDSMGGTFSSGYFTQISTGLTTPLFFGATTTGTFASFTITSQGPTDKITLDNISVGSSGSDAPAVPETGTLLSVGTGLLLLRYARRWVTGPGAHASGFLS